jgi:hypothetical protein
MPGKAFENDSTNRKHCTLKRRIPKLEITENNKGRNSVDNIHLLLIEKQFPSV